MDGGGNIVLGSVHRRKATKKKQRQQQPKKKPIKVVYISNPMKVQTSASEFRALVQELTGQDAEFPDPTKFLATDNGGGGGHSHHDKKVDANANDDDDDDNNHHSLALEAPVEDLEYSGVDHEHLAAADSNNSLYDAFDDLFPPPMIENFSELLQSAVMYHSFAI